MKKNGILLLIAVAVIIGLIFPKPISTILELIILIPISIYLIIDIVKNGNKFNDK